MPMMDAVAAAQNAPDFRVPSSPHHIHVHEIANTWQFELFDTCVLKDQVSLIAIILRTYHDFNSHEPIADCLIIAHVQVPNDVMQSFLISGIPPKGYVFIRFAKQEFGHSLVSERDVHLVSRAFAMGDSVKRSAADSMIGTVTSIFDSYVLEPITSTLCPPHKPQKLFEVHPGSKQCDETCVPRLPEYIYHPLPHSLLYDIPGDELKRADDFEPGDYIIEREELGIVQDHDIDAVMLLENNTVVMVENAWELELVVPELNRPLVALPELDDLRRPDVAAYQVGAKAFIPTDHLSRGQFVTTNHRNLRNGRWLVGEYDASCATYGTVLDVRTRRAHIKWLCPNAYVPIPYVDRAFSALRPYDNLSSYNNPRDLRRTKGLNMLDRGQRPRSSDGKCSFTINTGQDLEAGDQVRFRDQSGAFVKYQGNGHGQYNRVPKDMTFGFDMNEFIVLYSKQTVQIRWQDGSIIEQPSVSLQPYVMPEQEPCPGDIISLKEGSTQVAVGESESTATEFNEMLYLQGDYILRPEKVGVIQSVNARERLVRVRWFLKPMVRLLQQGNVLQRGAYFGPISDVIEDVSLYEIMAHPTLMRKRRDLVVLPPQNSPLDIVEAVSNHISISPFDDDKLGSALLSWARPPPGMDMNTYLRAIANPIAGRDLKDPNFTPDDQYHHTLDWVGEILDLGLDGMLTVRLCALPHCAEIQVPWERVLTIVDDEAAIALPAGAPDAFMDEEMEDEEYLSDGSFISAMQETIEYEGGSRIDNESGDEGWSTDADDGEDGTRRNSNHAMDIDAVGSITKNSHSQEITIKQESFQEQELILQQGHAASTQQQPMSSIPPEQSPSASIPKTPPIPMPPVSCTITTLLNLAANQSEAPPSFLVLDTPPAPDQFLGPRIPSSSTFSTATATTTPSPTFLKRIHREHLILSTSLPPSQIYIRTYDSRLDLLRAIILGPADTPYEFAPFLIDLFLPPNYPSVPPIAHFHSWTSGLGRINPNLYEEGKICLSLLGTWPGRGIKGESDTWSEKANLLQVLMSLMGLVLVKRPFYNEAGFEGYEGEGAYQVESALYSEKAYVMARGFVRYALCNSVRGLEDCLAWLYVSKVEARQGGEVSAVDGGEMGMEKGKEREVARPELLEKLMRRAMTLMEYSSSCTGDERDELVDGAGRKNAEAFMRPLSQGAVVMLRRHLEVLEKAFHIQLEN
jgi:ubiquitin-conjugating enzyme E2 O